MSEAVMPDLRRPPSGLVRWFFDVPAVVYRLGLGRVFGRRFLLITHRGRRSGRIRRTVVEAVHFDPALFESVVMAGWGDRTHWYRNIVASPALRIETGGRRYRPVQRRLDPHEVHAALLEYVRANPWAHGMVEGLSGIELDGDPGQAARIARLRGVAFRPDPDLEAIDRRRARRRTTRRVYDALARWYGRVADPFESEVRAAGIDLLDATPGETIVELGAGTGAALTALGGMVGAEGRVIGLDLSPAMVAQAQHRIEAEGLEGSVSAAVGDAIAIGLPAGSADGVFMAFVLESLAAQDVPLVLAETRRILRPGGRLVVVALDLEARPDREARPGLVERAYGAVQRLFPTILDCRPMDVAGTLADAGFDVETTGSHRMAGLPVSVTRARPRLDG